LSDNEFSGEAKGTWYVPEPEPEPDDEGSEEEPEDE
jgi:hypothetical protein